MINSLGGGGKAPEPGQDRPHSVRRCVKLGRLRANVENWMSFSLALGHLSGGHLRAIEVCEKLEEIDVESIVDRLLFLNLVILTNVVLPAALPTHATH